MANRNITGAVRQCECGAYFVPDHPDDDCCDVCMPSASYARDIRNYEHHPFQPARIDDLTDCEDE